MHNFSHRVYLILSISGSFLTSLVLFLSLSSQAHPIQAATVTFTVNSLSDLHDSEIGDGVCNAASTARQCTLRAAIEEASVSEVANPQINFDPSLTLPATITLSDPLTVRRGLVLWGPTTGQLILDGQRFTHHFEIAMLNQRKEVSITIANLTLLHGNNPQSGGAIALSSSTRAYTVALSNMTFENNAANVRGGAIASFDGVAVHIANSTFYSNSAPTGGAIGLITSQLRVVNSRFVQNLALNPTQRGNGGAIHCSTVGQITLEQSTFSENFAGSTGGALGLDRCNAQVISSTWSYNRASNFGGALFSSTAVSTLTNELMTSNSLIAPASLNAPTVGVIQLIGNTFEGNRAYEAGGAIEVIDSQLTIDQSILRNNKSYDNGGAMLGITSLMTMTNITLTGNSADSGGAISTRFGQLTVSNSRFDGNGANAGGGAFYCFGGKAQMAATTLTTNQTGGDGGAIVLNSGCNLQLSRSMMTWNKARQNGGAIKLIDSSTTIQQSFLSNNQAAEGNGGAIHNLNSGFSTTSLLTLTNSTLSSNMATLGNGGAIANVVRYPGGGAKITSQNNTLYNNLALAGGGLYNHGELGFGNALVEMANTILAGNLISPTLQADDCLTTNSPASRFLSLGYNIASVSTNCLFDQAGDQIIPAGQLAAVIEPTLNDNGGPTPTHALQRTGAAIDHGDPTGCKDAQGQRLTVDQRGVPRIGHCDPGAYEGVFISAAASGEGNDVRALRTLTVTVFDGKDETGTPVPTIPISLTITGTVQIAEQKESNQKGQAVFTYISEAPAPTFAAGLQRQLAQPTMLQATDFVNFWADLDKNGKSAAGEPKIVKGLKTPITLASFSAEVEADQVALQWRTATEIDNAGFNLYRATSPEGPYVLLNPQLIAAEGNGGGASYRYVDQVPVQGLFYYKLEDVDYNGGRTRHGPIQVAIGPTAGDGVKHLYVPSVRR